MNPKNNQQSKNSNVPKTTRFISTPQVFEYENSKDYDNSQQFLLDDLENYDQKPKTFPQKLVFTTTTTIVDKKAPVIQSHPKVFNEPMEIERPKHKNENVNFSYPNFRNLTQNVNQQNITPQLAAIDQQFEMIQKLTQKRQEQINKKMSPQKALVGAIKQKQYKRFSERGINLESFLNIAPQIQKKSGRKTFDVQEINAIKEKADKMTDQIGKNKKNQQSKNLKFADPGPLHQQEPKQIKSQELSQKIDFAKKKKQRLTMNLFQIMGMMEKVQEKKPESYKYEKKKRQSRLTINLDSITKMFQNDAFLHSQQQNEIKPTNIISSNTIIEDRLQDNQSQNKSRNRNMQCTSEQELNRKISDNYFSGVDARIQNLKKQNSKLQQLKQTLLRQKKLSQQGGYRINPEKIEEAKFLNSQYIAQTKNLQQKINENKFSQSLKVINSFNFELQMVIYKFQADPQNDPNDMQTFFSKFKIGSHLVKIRRTRENQQIQVRIKQLVIPQVHEAESLFEPSTLGQILYNFISKKLNHKKTLLQVLLGLSNFYTKIKQLETQLQQLMDLLNLTQFELSSTVEHLSFKYQLNSKDIYLFEIKLLNILGDKTVDNYVSIYSRRKRQYMQLPVDYRPFKNFLLYNEIDFIQQNFTVFEH